MSSLSAFFYDQCMKATESACLMDWRKELLQNVHGKVLEIGAGTGASIELYPDNPSLDIYMSEPDKSMRLQLEEKLKHSTRTNIQTLACASEHIDMPDDSFDFVFVSLVCCSVSDVQKSLSEIKRVLKKDGQFIFMEHVAAPAGTGRRKWQDRLNFLWRKLAGNCHLNRETESQITQAGFTIQSIKHDSMRKAMPLVRPCIRGIAVVN